MIDALRIAVLVLECSSYEEFQHRVMSMLEEEHFALSLKKNSKITGEPVDEQYLQDLSSILQTKEDQ